MNLWMVLEAIVIGQLVVALLIAYSLRSVKTTPLGKKLMSVATIFLAQSIIAIVIYQKWSKMGYGVDISGPLLGVSSLSLLGLLLLYAIIKS